MKNAKTISGLVVGALAIFAGLTANQSDRERKQPAYTTAFAVAIIFLIVTPILATHKSPSIEAKLMVSTTCVAVAAITWLCLYFATPISRMLGVAGMNIVETDYSVR